MELEAIKEKMTEMNFIAQSLSKMIFLEDDFHKKMFNFVGITEKDKKLIG